MTDKIKLDVFSLVWFGSDPNKSRSSGIMSVQYNHPIDQDIMNEVLLSIFNKYTIFFAKLLFENKFYYLNIPKTVTEKEIFENIEYTNSSVEDIFKSHSQISFDLFSDDFFNIIISHNLENFTIIIHGSHLIGDGMTSATLLSLILHNYHSKIHALPMVELPEISYNQLLNYAYNMRYNRFGKFFFVPKFLRFIPGIYQIIKTNRIEVEDQVFTGFLEDHEILSRTLYKFNNDFNQLLQNLKSEYNVNSNHLITGLIAYSYCELFGYNSTVLTYPINIRNKIGFEAGNLLTVNRVKIKFDNEIFNFILYIKKTLNKERKRKNPYYAISAGKFLKNDFNSIKERMSKLAKQSNLRISNLGRLPTPNLEFPDPELFNEIPMSNYHANALPLGSILVHFFISSVNTVGGMEYYLTILHNKENSSNLSLLLNKINENIKYLNDKIN